MENHPTLICFVSCSRCDFVTYLAAVRSRMFSTSALKSFECAAGGGSMGAERTVSRG